MAKTEMFLRLQINDFVRHDQDLNHNKYIKK